ncbi:MAG: MBL fold metallo-hydrolase [Bacilli bacterium]|nr:MBL fold metallo-hydrolase [Bacilli bacterium]
MLKVGNEIYYVGASSHDVDLFESHFVVPNGMAYNSYIIMDEKIAILDSCDVIVQKEWLKNVKEVLGNRKPDYLIIQHMEPDHSASLVELIKLYPDVTVVAGEMAFNMFHNYFRGVELKNKLVLSEGQELSLGKHVLKFFSAPMVHWPEVFVTYDMSEKALFSADAFGKFGAFDFEEDWACEARRYYFGIVGKYGLQVQMLLRKLSGAELKAIYPLHGPILKENLSYYLGLYDKWSKYEPEADGVFIAYTSVYGHTKAVVEEIAEKLKAKGCPKVSTMDIAREDIWEAVEDSFKYGKVIFATTTYNMSIFPYMNELLTALVERNYQNRRVGFVQNGSWAPVSGKLMKEKLAGCKNLEFVEPMVQLVSSKSEANEKEIDALVDAMLK